MPYSIRHDVSGCSGYAVVKTKTGEVVGCHKTIKDANKQLVALHINVESKETQKLFMYGGSSEFKVEYNVPDCQGGWAVLKDGTGQVVGCYKTEDEANKHREELTIEMTDILGDEVRTSKSPNEYAETNVVNKAVEATSFWDGVFFPSQKGVMGPDTGSEEQDTGWRSTYNTPPQKDGTPSTGYGNRSGGTNPK